MNGWTKPKGIAYLELTGPDAARFLNGQVSNDVSGDLSSKVVTACVCSMKGKIEALIRVTHGFSDESSLLIEVEESQQEAVLGRLDRYLIADDCEFSDSVTTPELTHIIVDQTDIPNAREHWRFGVKGFDVFGEVELGSLEELSSADLARSKVSHGIPEWDHEMTGEEFPASLGLDKWAVDFHKGCYLGQEIVSRIESAGKIPKKLSLYRTKKAFAKGAVFEDDKGKENAKVTRDSVADGDQYLTPVLAKKDFAHEGFEELTIQYPPKM